MKEFIKPTLEDLNELREKLLKVEKNPDYHWAFKPGIKFNVLYTKCYLFNYYKQFLMY